MCHSLDVELLDLFRNITITVGYVITFNPNQMLVGLEALSSSLTSYDMRIFASIVFSSLAARNLPELI